MRYKLVNTEENIQRLKDYGFTVLPYAKHHFYTNWKQEGGKQTVHMIIVDKITNEITYIIDTEERHDDIDIEKIEPMIKKKLNQLLERGVICSSKSPL